MLCSVSLRNKVEIPAPDVAIISRSVISMAEPAVCASRSTQTARVQAGCLRGHPEARDSVALACRLPAP
jgi:hypothetical protein